jgi:hypothetical protein
VKKTRQITLLLFRARRQRFFEPQSSMERMERASPTYLSRLIILDRSPCPFMAETERVRDERHFASVGHKMILRALIFSSLLTARSIVT